jgi:hypothetical protein
MKRTLIATVLASSLALQFGCQTSAPQQASKKSSYPSLGNSSDLEGRVFLSTLHGEQLLQTPQWSPRKDRPPLSPGAARRAAEQMLQQNVKNMSQWKLEEIVIVEPFHEMPSSFEPDYWIYRCKFKGPRYKTEHGSEMRSSADIIVLMDGSVVPLKRSDVK